MNPTYLEMLKVAQNNILRMIVDATWFMRNEEVSRGEQHTDSSAM